MVWQIYSGASFHLRIPIGITLFGHQQEMSFSKKTKTDLKLDNINREENFNFKSHLLRFVDVHYIVKKWTFYIAPKFCGELWKPLTSYWYVCLFIQFVGHGDINQAVYILYVNFIHFFNCTDFQMCFFKQTILVAWRQNNNKCPYLISKFWTVQYRTMVDILLKIAWTVNPVLWLFFFQFQIFWPFFADMRKAKYHSFF